MPEPTPLHELSEPNQKIVCGILDMYIAAWSDGIPDIDHFTIGVAPDALPTLLYEIVQCEAGCIEARGLFPQQIHCANTPELEYAVAAGRSMAEFVTNRLLPRIREIAKFEFAPIP